MKTLQISLFVVAAMATSSAFAQINNLGSRNQVGVQSQGQNRDLTKRALHASIEEINKGLKVLREGLPIYQGNRVDAIDFGILAKSEILTGLLEQHLNKAEALNKKQGDGESKKKYSDQQIHQSNERLVIGGHHFENALGILTRTNWDFQSHNMAAQKDLRKALDEIRAALAPYGGPSVFMPKNGFRDGHGKPGSVIHP